jgi:F-type H+-transporting ATPase subunit delta
MKNTKVSKRYATALLEFALEKSFLENARDDMETILMVYNSSKEFRMFLSSPVISSSRKIAVINELFSSKVSQGTLSYLVTLVKKRREMNIGTIAAEFLKLYKDYKNIKSATLKTAVAIDDETRTRIISMVKEKFGCEVELEEEVNPALIGGFILKVGDYQFDTTIFSELNHLRKQFQQNVYKKEF